MRATTRSLVMFWLVVVLTGGHVALLQTVAWSSMLATRVQTQGWTQAVESTFSGKQPCRMCLVAQALGDDELGDDRDTKQPQPKTATQKCDLMVGVEILPPLHSRDAAAILSCEPPTLWRIDAAAPEPPPPQPRHA